MSKVKLRLSGITAFTSQIVGYIVGILFATMISRRLSEKDFGAWTYIGTIVAYAVLPTDLFGLWITRDAARGRKILGPAILIHLPFLFASLLAFIVLTTPVATAVNLSEDIPLLGLLILVPLFFKNLFEALAKGCAYQYAGIAVMLFEFTKLVIGAVLVAYLRMGLLGVFVTLALSYGLQATYLALTSRDLFSNWFDLATMKRWFKGSIFTIFSMLNNYLTSLDIVLISVIVGSTLITGYWQATIIIGSLVKTSGFLMGGLGQKLLAGGSQRDVDKSFSFTMILSVPMLFGAIILSGDLLWILRPAYSTAWPVACFLSISGFLSILIRFYSSILSGTDIFDLKDEVSFKDYVKSKIFLGTKISLLTSLAYVFSATAFLLLASRIEADIITILVALAVANLIATFISLLLHSYYVHKLTDIRLNLRSLIPNFEAASIMSVLIILIRLMINPRAQSLFESVRTISVFTLVGAIVYFLVLWVLSPDFRNILKDVRAFLAKC